MSKILAPHKGREKMKKCELCMSSARTFCKSDKASLCWGCDARVHSANFLVAKHVRSLLCQSCQSITPWTASGSKFSPTFSLCQSCCAHKNPNNTINHHDHLNDGQDHDDHEYNDNDDDEDENEEHGEDSYDGDHEDDGENQVVPLYCNSSTLGRLPRFSTSSSSE